MAGTAGCHNLLSLLGLVSTPWTSEIGRIPFLSSANIVSGMSIGIIMITCVMVIGRVP